MSTAKDVSDRFPECFRAERLGTNTLILTKLDEPVLVLRQSRRIPCDWELQHLWHETASSSGVKGSTVSYYFPSEMDGFDDHDVPLFDVFEVV